MEITTLLKANIRHKKGAFISVLILAFLIVTTAAASFGARNNFETALHRAQNESDCPNITAMIAEKELTDELLSSVENSELVERVKVYDSIDRSGDIICGNKRDGNSWFFQKLRDGIKLVNKDFDGFEDTVPKLSAGEIYLTTGLQSKFECNIGDTVRAEFSDGEHQFKIKGFVQEPVNGAMMIGWKQVFISDEDFDSLKQQVSPYETDTRTSFFKIVNIYKADKDLNDAKFGRQLNLETGIISKSSGSLTLAQSENYTGLLLRIILYVFIGFVLILFIIVLVVIFHSIKTEIEIDFVNLGILKSQGFTNSALTKVIMLRYALAELIGAALGVLVSFPLERLLSSVFKGITGIIPDKSLAVIETSLLVLGMLALSALIIFISTRKLARISPVRAVSGGKNEVYFSSRLNAQISGRALGASIAYRGFSSAVKRYLGILIIAVILTFFTVTVNIMAAMVSSRKAIEAMGATFYDIGIELQTDASAEHIEEYEELIEKYSPIEQKEYGNYQYISLNGENIYCEFIVQSDTFSMIKGRAPTVDNEIVITQAVSDALELSIGDEVTVEGRKQKAQFIVSGIMQSMNDAGHAMGMSFDGAKRLGAKRVSYLSFVLEDTSKIDEIAAELNEKYSGIEANAYDFEKEMDEDVIIIAANVIRLVIYGFSGVFALVSVLMVCTGTFIQERQDLGIYKAIGFTSGKLRRIFAIRFFMISLIGSIIGSVLAGFFSADVLNMIFSLFGIVRVKTVNTPLTYIGAATFICVLITVFAYFAARKVKWVEVRELITE